MPKSQATKEKRDKMGIIKMRNFCTSEEIFKKVKTGYIMRENFSLNYVFLRDLDLKNTYVTTQ